MYSSFYSLFLANWGIDNLRSYQMNEWTDGRANEYDSLSNIQLGSDRALRNVHVPLVSVETGKTTLQNGAVLPAKVRLIYDPAFHREIYVPEKCYGCVLQAVRENKFITSLFHISPNWIQPECSSVAEWINKCDIVML